MQNQEFFLVPKHLKKFKSNILQFSSNRMNFDHNNQHYPPIRYDEIRLRAL